MRSKKLALALNLIVVLVLAFGLVLPGLFVGTASGIAYAATSTANSAADWEPVYNGNYYDGINENSTGTALRSQLRDLITRTHTTQTVYNGSSSLALNNVWPKTDIDPATGKMIWFYSGTPRNGFNGTSNREHVWPKNSGKAFPAESGPGADAHHLRPTDSTLNSTRGSLQFGEVAQTSSNIAKENGQTKYGNYDLYGMDALCYKSGGYFYPAKGFRGQTARILMYMQTRWGDNYNLQFVLGQGSNKTIGDVKTLLKWHIEEPPEEAEIYRNNAVATIQGNRNPFIDHPEYAAAIYCNDGNSYNNALKQVVEQYGDYNQERPDLESLTLTPSTVNLTAGATQTLTVQASPAGANANVKWSSSNTSVATVNNGIVTAVSDGSAVITATSVADDSIKATANVVVKKATAIEIIGNPSVTQYQQGQTFNPSGLTVKIVYDDGTSVSVSSVNELKQQFQWLDNDTGQQMLTVGTKSIKCKYGDLEQVSGWTVTVKAPPENISGFIDKVSAINSATTLSGRFSAIKEAFAAYDLLTDAEKTNASAIGAYETLQQAIAEYNADIASNNEVMQNATKSGAYAVCGATLAAAALITLLSRRFG